MDRDETVTFDQDDNEYLIAHSKDGTTSFYSNAWDAAARMTLSTAPPPPSLPPADSNAFYHYTEDTPCMCWWTMLQVANQLFDGAEAQRVSGSTSVIVHS